MRGEVRLLKKFMQGIGVYGAEIKVGGFSGYLCELLIMKYGSFTQTIRAFAQYNQRVVIDIEGFYADRGRMSFRCFSLSHLLSLTQLIKEEMLLQRCNLKNSTHSLAHARAFLKKPTEEFFYPPKPKVLSSEALKNQLEKRGSSIVFLVIGELNAVPDVLWGQLYRSKRSLRTLLELNDYKVLKDAVWSNEKTLSVFMFELEAASSAQHQEASWSTA